MKQLAAEEPAAGIKFMEGIEHLEAPPREYLECFDGENNVYAHLDGFRQLSKDELPPGVKWGVRYWTWCLNSPVYLAFLLRKFILKGGETKEYTLSSPMEAFELAKNVKTVVNCSGMGFADPKSFIIRGMKPVVLSFTMCFSVSSPLTGAFQAKHALSAIPVR